MKKICFIILTLSMFVLCSCSNKTTKSIVTKDENGMIVDDKIRHYEIDLNMDNYWKYFENTVNEYSAGANSHDTIEYENLGVLSFAYYENVIFTFELSCEIKNSGELIHYDLGTIQIETKADGYCKYRFPTKYEIDGTERDMYFYTKKLEVVSITGKIVFSA